MSKKRAMSLLLALVLCLCLLPVSAMAVSVTEAVPCKYDDVRDFSEGLAAVRIGDWETGKWGFIDKSGKEVIPCKFDLAGSFSNGLAEVKLDGEKIYIDKTGKEVAPPYGEEDTSTQYVSKAGISTEGLLAVNRGSRPGGVNGTSAGGGAWDITPGAWSVEAGNWGFVDETGREVIPCQYRRAWPFFDGLAVVEGDSGEKDHRGETIYKYGFIDKSGTEVIPCQYDNAYSFSEGLAAVCLDGKWSYIDKTGKVIISLDLEGCNWAGSFSEGFAAISLEITEMNEWGFEVESHPYYYIDTTGKIAIPGRFGSAHGFFKGVAVVSEFITAGNPTKWLINKQGEMVTPEYWDIYDFYGGYAVVISYDYQDYQYGLIDETGKEVVPCKYDDMYNVSEGMAAVCLDDKWGFIAILEDTALSAKSTVQKVSVDGKDVDFYTYEIEDYNYVKLRDLAYILNGTNAQFKVDYDSANDRVVLISGQSYTEVGGEMAAIAAGVQKPCGPSTNAYTLDGKPYVPTAYTIDDYNYIKLRDLGIALNFNVGWSEEQGIYIETNKPYDPAN